MRPGFPYPAIGTKGPIKEKGASSMTNRVSIPKKGIRSPGKGETSSMTHRVALINERQWSDTGVAREGGSTITHGVRGVCVPGDEEK